MHSNSHYFRIYFSNTSYLDNMPICLQMEFVADAHQPEGQVLCETNLNSEKSRKIQVE
jgi:hypothetical protein